MNTRVAGWSLVAVLLVLATAATARRVSGDAEPLPAVPSIDTRDRYAGSDSCKSCHPAAYATWHDSFHRTMTQRAGPQSILGVFDGRALDAAGRYRVERDGDAFFVTDPEHGRRRVTLVTGSHHMQVYWPEPDAAGRLEAFAFAFLLPEQRWVPNEATLLRPPSADDPLQGEAAPTTYTWNRVCIKCHAVAGVPGFTQAEGVAASRVAELGIACEACHGPGAAHVDANKSPPHRYAQHLGAEAAAVPMMNPDAVPPATASQACAQCHSITTFHDDAAWVARGHDSAPPDPLGAWGTLVQHPLLSPVDNTDALLEDDPDFFANRFWSDGMVRVSGREYNGLVESPCAADPQFSCLSCHRMHSEGTVDGGPWTDDQLHEGARQGEPCGQCHVGKDGPDHTHHPVGSDGSDCLNCHMPRTTYGLLKAIRSHRIDSPDVEATIITGRPNACNLCHLDRTLTWTAEHLSAWYGVQIPTGLADADPDHAAAVAWLVGGDAGQRALVAWHLSWPPAREASGDAWQGPLLAALLDDPYSAVRIVAARSLQRLTGFERDPLRAAAGELAGDVQQQWAVDHADAPARPEVFALPGGRVDMARLAALRARRDDRPVALAE